VRCDFYFLEIDNLQSPGLGEGLEAAVVSFFNGWWKTTTGQLLAREVIAYTLTAHPLSITAGVCTAAIF
jgi:hypothetical protein